MKDVGTVRLRCAIFAVDTTRASTTVSVDVSPSVTIAALRTAVLKALVAVDRTNRFLLGPMPIWKLYAAKHDGDWLNDDRVRRMTSYDVQRSGYPSIDPTASLDCEELFGRGFPQPQRQSQLHQVHVLALVRNKDEWLTLKIAALEEDEDEEAMYLELIMKRTDSVAQLHHSIARWFDKHAAHSDFMWRLYVAQRADGSWPSFESVNLMKCRELVLQDRPHMASGRRLDEYCGGPGWPASDEHCVHVLAITTDRRRELNDRFVSVKCAILPAPALIRNIKPLFLKVDVRPADSVQHVETAIKYELGYDAVFQEEHWKLYLARGEFDDWYADTINCGEVERDDRQALDPGVLIASEQCFGHSVHANRHLTRILVDTQTGSGPPSPQETLRAICSTATSTARLPENLGDVDMDQWLDMDCGSTVGISPLAEIFPVLPASYFVRKENLVVWNEFKTHFQSRFTAYSSSEDHSSDDKQFVLVGSSGVGKSSLLLLMCVHLAVRLRCRVVLYQKRYNSCSCVWYLAGDEGNVYAWGDPGGSHDPWSEERVLSRVVELATTARNVSGPVWISTDGLTQHETTTQLRGLTIDLLVLPFPRFVVRYKPTLTVRICLLPCWRESDLTALGKLRGMADDECKARYAVSGGILMWFLGDLAQAKQIIGRAVKRLVAVDQRDYAPRMCQSTCDEIFTLATVVDRSEDYTTELRWRHEVTSAFAWALLPNGYKFRRL